MLNFTHFQPVFNFTHFDGSEISSVEGTFFVRRHQSIMLCFVQFAFVIMWVHDMKSRYNWCMFYSMCFTICRQGNLLQLSHCTNIAMSGEPLLSVSFALRHYGSSKLFVTISMFADDSSVIKDKLYRKYPAIHTHYSWSNCTISN